MSSTKNFNLRFAVGSPNGRRSGLWRLWTGKPPNSDVYLAARAGAGYFKVSLHQSGDWQASFTSQFERELIEEGSWELDSRHIDTWQRPRELDPGVTLCFTIVVPESELRVMPFQIEKKKPILWVEPPPAGMATEFAFLLTKLETPLSDWLRAKGIRVNRLAEHSLPNHETLWVVERAQKAAEIICKSRIALKRRLASGPPMLCLGEIDSARPTHRFMVSVKMKDGSRSWVEFARDSMQF